MQSVAPIFLLWVVWTHTKAASPVDVIAKSDASLPAYDLETLRRYNGSDDSLPILLGLKGFVFDVTKGSKFYGPGTTYSHFAGRDVTRNTAMFSTDEKDLDRTDFPDSRKQRLDGASS